MDHQPMPEQRVEARVREQHLERVPGRRVTLEASAPIAPDLAEDGVSSHDVRPAGQRTAFAFYPLVYARSGRATGRVLRSAGQQQQDVAVAGNVVCARARRSKVAAIAMVTMGSSATCAPPVPQGLEFRTISRSVG